MAAQEVLAGARGGLVRVYSHQLGLPGQRAADRQRGCDGFHGIVQFSGSGFDAGFEFQIVNVV
jgi:hypothetical protein